MNKMTKLGVSALCGSLAAVSSANAGDLSASGAVDMTWISMDDENTGNPIGISSNYTLSGSGELDNGWGVALAIQIGNKNIYSNTNVVVTVPSIGDVRIDQGTSGTGIDRIDDITPMFGKKLMQLDYQLVLTQLVVVQVLRQLNGHLICFQMALLQE